MKVEGIEKVAVIGAGVMGSQIAELLSRVGGYEVYMVDMSDELVEKGLKAIEDRLQHFFVSKGKMTAEEEKGIRERIRGSTWSELSLKHIDLVLEAVLENLALKKEVFKKLDGLTPSQTILASNTSYQSITEIASATNRPERVIGTHFFNPVGVMRLVEVVTGARTSDETISVTCALMAKLGKEPVVCKDTSYGFLANRAYRAMMLEAVQMVWERVASPGDIDKTLKLGYNLPMGPLELGDVVGSWRARLIEEEDSVREMGPEKGRVHPLIRAMVRAGYTGGPGQKGIYDYWKEVLSK